MKKYLTGIVAVMLGMLLAFGTSSFEKSKAVLKNKPLSSYYYQFTGTHGNESNLNLWDQLSSLTDYNNLTCPIGSTNSCKIINTTNSAGHPTAVPLDANGFPVQGTVNTDVKLKQ